MVLKKIVGWDLFLKSAPAEAGRLEDFSLRTFEQMRLFSQIPSEFYQPHFYGCSAGGPENSVEIEVLLTMKLQMITFFMVSVCFCLSNSYGFDYT